MNKADQLFIRACKTSGDSQRRLTKLYRSHYLPHKTESTHNKHIVRILLRICDDLSIDIDYRQLLDRCDPDYSWPPERDLSYWDIVLGQVVSCIAHTTGKHLIDQGYIVPAKFRS